MIFICYFSNIIIVTIHLCVCRSFELVVCHLCGSQAIHSQCKVLLGGRSDADWHCPECTALLTNSVRRDRAQARARRQELDNKEEEEEEGTGVQTAGGGGEKESEDTSASVENEDKDVPDTTSGNAPLANYSGPTVSTELTIRNRSPASLAKCRNKLKNRVSMQFVSKIDNKEEDDTNPNDVLNSSSDSDIFDTEVSVKLRKKCQKGVIRGGKNSTPMRGSITPSRLSITPAIRGITPVKVQNAVGLHSNPHLTPTRTPLLGDSSFDCSSIAADLDSTIDPPTLKAGPSTPLTDFTATNALLQPYKDSVMRDLLNSDANLPSPLNDLEQFASSYEETLTRYKRSVSEVLSTIHNFSNGRCKLSSNTMKLFQTCSLTVSEMVLLRNILYPAQNYLKHMYLRRKELYISKKGLDSNVKGAKELEVMHRIELKSALLQEKAAVTALHQSLELLPQVSFITH